MYNNGDGAIRLCRYMTSYLREIVLFSQSLIVYENLTQNMKFQLFYLENDVSIKKEKSGTCPVRLEIVDSI